MMRCVFIFSLNRPVKPSSLCVVCRHHVLIVFGAQQVDNKHEMAVLGSEEIESTHAALSEFHGPEVVLDVSSSKMSNLKFCTLSQEESAWLKREFLLSITPLGGVGGVLSTVFSPVQVLTQVLPTDIRTKYRYYRWKNIKIRITSSDPKACVGMYSIVCVPFTNDLTYISGSAQGPYIDQCWSMPLYSFAKSLGSPGDVEFDFPWSYRTAIVPTTEAGSIAVPTRVGTPLLQIAIRDQTYINSVPIDPIFRIYVQFEDFEVFAPIYAAQSGIMATMTGALLGDFVQAGVKYAGNYVGVDLGGVASTAKTSTSNYFKEGTSYTDPVDVLPSYFGDTNSEIPMVGANLRSHADDFVMHPQKPISDVELMHFLKRPQFLGTFTGVNNFTNHVLGNRTNYTPATERPTWLTYFAKTARYWRGDIYMDVMVHGHPTVETRLRSIIQYKTIDAPIVLAPNEQEVYSQFESNTFVFQGPKTYSFRLPLATEIESMPTDQDPSFWTTQLQITVQSLSSLITPLPVISYSVFVRAAENFVFLDPVSTSANAVYSQSMLHPPGEEFNPVDSSLKRGGVFKELRTFRDAISCWSGVNFNQNMVEYPSQPRLRWGSFKGSKDFLAYFMDLFLLYKGGISYKLVISPDAISGRKIVGVALSEPYSTGVKTIPVTLPTDPQPIPTYLDLGKGAIITNPTLQPLLQFTLPYRGSYSFGFCSQLDEVAVYPGIVFDPSVDTNASFIRTEGGRLKFADKMYRKAASDFSFAVETLPPPLESWSG